jgi:putative membrane protein
MIIQIDLKRGLTGLLLYQRYEVAFAAIFSSVVYILYELHGLTFLAPFNFVPIGFFSAIISVFLAFRNNSAYSRWWEARTLWGELVNTSRTFGMQVFSVLTPPGNSDLPETSINHLRKELILRHLAFINLMRMQLRGNVDMKEVAHFLSAEDITRLKQAINPAVQLNLIQGECLRDAMKQGWLSDFRLVAMTKTLEQFYNIIGACERIKNTPFPREYDGFIRVLIWLLILILPIYLLTMFSDEVSKLLIIPVTIFTALIIGFANKAGYMLEDPFENRIHDIPMTSLCNTIENDLLQQLQEDAVLTKVEATNGIVW